MDYLYLERQNEIQKSMRLGIQKVCRISTLVQEGWLELYCQLCHYLRSITHSCLHRTNICHYQLKLGSNMKSIIYVSILIALTSCNQNKSNKVIVDDAISDSVLAESCQTINDTIKPFQTQAEINKACFNEYVANEDSVEKEFQNLLKALPQYRKEFLKEKAIWEKYQNAVLEVSRCEDHGSSTPMYVSAVLSQGTQIRGVPQHYLYLHVQGKDISYSKTTFTQTMIADAYSAYIMAVGEDEYIEQKTTYQEALRKEQRCWDELLECRKETSKLLTGDLKKVYELGTNQMLRTKLYQLKNQNQDLGMTSGEVMKCALPENCSYKELLEYPGLDKIWAKHCEDLDWYPKFN